MYDILQLQLYMYSCCRLELHNQLHNVIGWF